MIQAVKKGSISPTIINQAFIKGFHNAIGNNLKKNIQNNLVNKYSKQTPFFLDYMIQAGKKGSISPTIINQAFIKGFHDALQMSVS